MRVYILKKEKGKSYDSKSICKAALNFELEYDGPKPIGASISDTKNYWVCCIGDCGIDIEEKGRKLKLNITKYLHALEEKYLSALSFGSSEWYQEFFHIWTAKEAVYKLTGLGLKEFSVLDDELSYKTRVGGYRLAFYEDRNLYLSLISADGEIEIEKIKYAGRTAAGCMDYAAGLLAQRDYSCSDIYNKLRAKGYNEIESGKCIERFKELGYLDDEAYARRFADAAMQSGKGAAYIKSKLVQSGIDSSFIPDIDRQSQFEQAMQIAESMYEDPGDYQERQKLLAKIGRKLAGRGFDSATVYRVLGNLK